MSSYTTHSLLKKDRNPELLSDIGTLVISNEMPLSYCLCAYSRQGKEAWSKFFFSYFFSEWHREPEFNFFNLARIHFSEKG
jgi:hypothetical protein